MGKQQETKQKKYKGSIITLSSFFRVVNLEKLYGLLWREMT